MKTLKNPGPQWRSAEEHLAALCASGNTVAIRVATKCPTSCEVSCRYFDGDNSPEGRLVESLKAMVWWDDTTVDDGKPVVPWVATDFSIEAPGGWHSDD